MMRHRRSPAVQHGGDADAGAEMLGVSRDRQHRLGGRPEQEIVDHRLILIGDIADWRWGEHYVNTTWTYGTGSSSAARAPIPSRAAAPWHFGQCRLRQLL